MDRPQTEVKDGVTVPNFEELSVNIGRFVEEAGKVTAAYLKPLEQGKADTSLADSVAEVVRTLGQVAENWFTDPQKMVEAQTRIGSEFLNLWATTLKRAQGAPVEPVARPEPKDNRFQDPEWTASPVFDFLKQAYLITTRWAEDMVEG